MCHNTWLIKYIIITLLCLIPLVASAEIAESPTVQAPIAGDVETVTKTSEGTIKIECSCVKTARSLGVPIPYNTDAKDIVPDGTPEIGGLIVLKYGDIYHIAVIQGFESGFNVSEGNFKECEMSERTIDFNDPHIVGFKRF